MSLHTAPPAAGPATRTADLPRPHLTDREIEILLIWLRSDTKEQAAAELFISGATISTHLARIRAKYAALGRPATTKTQLFVRAAQDRLLDIRAW